MDYESRKTKLKKKQSRMKSANTKSGLVVNTKLTRCCFWSVHVPTISRTTASGKTNTYSPIHVEMVIEISTNYILLTFQFDCVPLNLHSEYLSVWIYKPSLETSTTHNSLLPSKIIGELTKSKRILEKVPRSTPSLEIKTWHLHIYL